MPLLIRQCTECGWSFYEDEDSPYTKKIQEFLSANFCGEVDCPKCGAYKSIDCEWETEHDLQAEEN